MVYGQIEVENDNTVKITENVTVTRNDTDNPRVETNFTYNANSTNDVYALRNNSYGNSKHRYGVANSLSGTTDYGVGIYNNLNLNVLGNSGYPTLQGMYNRVYLNGFEEARGVRNYVIGGTNASSGHRVYGLENSVKMEDYDGNYYGVYNDIIVESSTPGGSAYGSKTYLSGTGSPAYAYGYSFSHSSQSNPYTIYGYYSYISSVANNSFGVYSNAPSATGHYAGYFTGNLYLNGSPLTSSDLRLKDEIKGISSGLSDILKLSPKKYKIKREQENRDRKFKYGFIAQELKEVFPDLVELVAQPGQIKKRVIRKGSVEIGPDGERNVIKEQIEEYQDMDGEPMFAINYQGLLAPIVAAIQEQDDKLSRLLGKGLSSGDSDKEVAKMAQKIEQSEIEIQELKTQISKLIDCTNCGDIELESRKIELDIDQLDMRLYPNPARDFVNLEISAGKTGLLKISIFNESGQLIMADDMMLIAGTNVHRMDSTTWTTGLYYITTTYGGITNSNKVVIE